jgi:hypothetical protein
MAVSEAGWRKKRKAGDWRSEAEFGVNKLINCFRFHIFIFDSS